MNQKIDVTPVILCGGSGTRLWPLSRAGFPKQFLCVTGEETLFQQAVNRFAQIGSESIALSTHLFVTGEEHRFLVTEQLREVGIRQFQMLLEPVGRNTAPALTLAALEAQTTGKDPVLVVTPADQTVAHSEAFNRAMTSAIKEAASGSVVLLGVTPDGPETGFGYIQAKVSKNEIFEVTRFVEKPDAITAQSYLEAGGYYWNAGIFVLRSSVWLEALNKFRPDILLATRKAWNRRNTDGHFIRPNLEEFKAVSAESIDYAVMEPSAKSGIEIKMVPLKAGWSDLGSWESVWQAREKDAQGNVQVGDVLSINTRNTIVHATSRLVAVGGVDDLVVIETPDAVMVVNRKKSQNVKQIVEAIKLDGRREQISHRKVHRPWGWFDSVDEGHRFKVKRIKVNPGASLSLQKHHHRAEHWIVVSGTAEITNNNKTKIFTENESTYIPLGELHMLKNPGKIPLEIIEVQTGSYLGEDDIVRISDEYNRT